jgi:hypothetical protein
MMAFGANKQMNTDISAANLQNLSENQGIANQAMQLQLNNMNLPGQMVNNAMAIENAPGQAYAANLGNALQPMSFVRIGGSQPFQNENMPLVQPNSFMSGLSQSMGGAGNAALSYYMQNQYANSLRSGYGGYPGYTPGYPGYTGTPYTGGSGTGYAVDYGGEMAGAGAGAYAATAAADNAAFAFE